MGDKFGEEIEEPAWVAAEVFLKLLLIELVEKENEVLDFGRCLGLAGRGFAVALFGEPVLVIGVAPTRKVVFVDMLAGWAEGGDDVRVGDAVLEHIIDLVAKGLREPGDFAGMTGGEEVQSARCRAHNILRS